MVELQPILGERVSSGWLCCVSESTVVFAGVCACVAATSLEFMCYLDVFCFVCCFCFCGGVRNVLHCDDLCVDACGY